MFIDKLTHGPTVSVIHPEASNKVYPILMTAVYQNICRINTRLG